MWNFNTTPSARLDDKKLKILLVDDDINIRSVYSEVFLKGGYDVLEASDGVEGLDVATRELPDVIFTGIVMPRMDGFTMMETLKKTVMTSNIPVVISSHMGREEDQKRANQLGAKEFIMSTVMSPKEVLERVNALFIKEGGEYKFDFDAYAMDAQKLARDLKCNTNYQCLECNNKLALNLKLLDGKTKTFEAKFVCPSCGWEVK
jgi:CheY-like chemotaxis protein